MLETTGLALYANKLPHPYYKLIVTSSGCRQGSKICTCL